MKLYLHRLKVIILICIVSLNYFAAFENEIENPKSLENVRIIQKNYIFYYLKEKFQVKIRTFNEDMTISSKIKTFDSQVLLGKDNMIININSRDKKIEYLE